MEDILMEKLRCYHFRGTFNNSSDFKKANLQNGDTFIYCDRYFIYYNDEMIFLDSFIDDESIKNKVLDFIKKFKVAGPEVIEECFSKGNCFWFAKILEERFHGQIYYSPIDNHFVCKIRDLYFDIFGEKIIKKEMGYQNWHRYKKHDSMETDRIYRDCIYKLSSDKEIDYAFHMCDCEFLRLKEDVK